MGLLINCYFGYSFYMAGFLRWNGITNIDGELISGGEAFTVILIVMISIMALATAGNNVP
jgi:hypothetical protein